MPLPNDGTLSINDIRGEMGDTPGDDRMSEYYAGAGYTPAGCEGVGGPVPTSGEVRISDFHGACVVTPQPNTYLECTGKGPDVSGIYVYPAATFGYSYYCLETSAGVFSPGFGSYSGDRFLDGGSINEGFYSIIFLREITAVAQSGMQILMFNDAFGSFYKYRFDISIVTSTGVGYKSMTLYSAQADSDATITARYGTSCGSTRSVRALYWNTGLDGPGGTPTDLTIKIDITRTSP